MHKNLFDLTGRRILITGSNGGIGHSLALGLAQHGATVILNGRSAAKLHAAAELLREQGLSAEEARFDITDEAEVADAIARLDPLGGVDVLMNNAGIQRRISLEHVDLETWNEVLLTNLTSAMLVSREIAKRMIQKRAGKIINVCSLMSDLGRITTGPYTAAKGGLKMLTKAMCADWAQYNIQINAIGPGYFITEMTQVLADNPEFDAWVKSRTPARRWGKPEELVGSAVFLSSAASDFVNGQIIYIDGGMISVL
ncbi:MAG: SDR family oxidoreductase [Verrucomicrobia bacterium]|jgi:gluconate 5-dehydrogenase|nr:SDR family oxidoreductase [Verrucomicrobiota bacterium]